VGWYQLPRYPGIILISQKLNDLQAFQAATETTVNKIEKVSFQGMAHNGGYGLKALLCASRTRPESCKSVENWPRNELETWCVQIALVFLLLAVSLLLQTAVYVFLDKSKFFSDTAWLFTPNKEVQTSKLAERITRLWLCKKKKKKPGKMETRIENLTWLWLCTKIGSGFDGDQTVKHDMIVAMPK
jgi:hypothetical protein